MVGLEFFSARYAGSECNTDANIRKLLNELKDQDNRQAKFKTVICLKNKSEHFFFSGECHGKITRFPQEKMDLVMIQYLCPTDLTILLHKCPLN